MIREDNEAGIGFGSILTIASMLGALVSALVSAGIWLGFTRANLDALSRKDAEFDEWRKEHARADSAHNESLNDQLRQDEKTLHELVGEVNEFHNEYRANEARKANR